MKPLIITLAVNGREDYIKLQQDLINSINRDEIDVWKFNEFFSWITPHEKVPYLFKYELIKEAEGEGYNQIFWLDSTMRLLKNPFELLQQSESGVVAFHNEGHPLYKYISDQAEFNLWKRGCLVDGKVGICDIQQTWGGSLGFDFTNPICVNLFKELFWHAEAGSFNDGGSLRAGFKAHRHDQAVMSGLLHQYNIPLLPYGVIAAKSDVTDKTYIQYGD